MPQPHTWLEEVIEALKELGGHGYLKDIYDKIYERNLMDFGSNNHWQDSVCASLKDFQVILSHILKIEIYFIQRMGYVKDIGD